MLVSDYNSSARPQSRLSEFDLVTSQPEIQIVYLPARRPAWATLLVAVGIVLLVLGAVNAYSAIQVIDRIDHSEAAQAAQAGSFLGRLLPSLLGAAVQGVS